MGTEIWNQNTSRDINVFTNNVKQYSKQVQGSEVKVSYQKRIIGWNKRRKKYQQGIVYDMR
jgi:hypothetical protein